MYTRPVTWSAGRRLPGGAPRAGRPSRSTGTRFQACTTGPQANCFYTKPPRGRVGSAGRPGRPGPRAVPGRGRAGPRPRRRSPPRPPRPRRRPPGRAGRCRPGRGRQEGRRCRRPSTPPPWTSWPAGSPGRRPAGGPAAGGLAALLAAAAFWGLVSLVTPCVFPMIPITVSLFLKQSHNSPGRVLPTGRRVLPHHRRRPRAVGRRSCSSVFRELSTDWRMNVVPRRAVRGVRPEPVRHVRHRPAGLPAPRGRAAAGGRRAARHGVRGAGVQHRQLHLRGPVPRRVRRAGRVRQLLPGRT